MSATKREAKRQAKILVVDDDPGLLRLLTIRLRSESYEVEPVSSAADALAAAVRFRPDLVITDLRMDKMDGMGLLKELQARWPSLKVIILTAHGTIPDAVRATQGGAFGFLTKPVEKQELLEHVRKALKISGMPAVDEEWRAGIVTRSTLLEEKLAQAQTAAGSDARVLLTGEAGVGKKLFARAIHAASARADGPFAVVTVAETAERELERALFGENGHGGALTAAHGGTVVVDDIADLPATLQVRLVELLKDRPADGDAAAHRPRLIAVSRRDLTQLMVSGRFREDLYYRLNVVHIDLPPLARRREDIPLLVAHFLAQIAAETGSRKIYAPEAVELLATVDWPGNVHQLQAVVRQNVATSPAEIISAEITQAAVGEGPNRLPSFDDARDEFTRNYLVQILQITGGNVSQAARLAKRNRTDFYKLLARHQLSSDEFKSRTP
jgi:two-component system, NtrC family, response regulator GlrR